MKKISIKPESFFKVLEGTDRSQVAEMVLSPGKSTGGLENVHADSDQWLYVVSGNGKAVVEGKSVKIKSGELLLIEAGETHEIVNEATSLLKPSAFTRPLLIKSLKNTVPILPRMN